MAMMDFIGIGSRNSEFVMNDDGVLFTRLHRVILPSNDRHEVQAVDQSSRIPLNQSSGKGSGPARKTQEPDEAANTPKNLSRRVYQTEIPRATQNLTPPK